MFLNVPRAYCYLCTIDLDHAQNIEELCKHGMVINRSIQDMWKNVSNLVKILERKKTNKGFKESFTPEVRNYQCGFPTFTIGGFSFHNLPTMHFKIHMFDFLKKVAYQMNSRNYTNSGKSVAEIQKLRGKDKFKKKKREEKFCANHI